MLVKLKNSQLVDTQRIAGVPVELFEFDIHLCIKSVCHVTDHVTQFQPPLCMRLKIKSIDH